MFGFSIKKSWSPRWKTSGLIEMALVPLVRGGLSALTRVTIMSDRISMSADLFQVN